MQNIIVARISLKDITFKLCYQGDDCKWDNYQSETKVLTSKRLYSNVLLYLYTYLSAERIWVHHLFHAYKEKQEELFKIPLKFHNDDSWSENLQTLFFLYSEWDIFKKFYLWKLIKLEFIVILEMLSEKLHKFIEWVITADE